MIRVIQWKVIDEHMELPSIQFVNGKALTGYSALTHNKDSFWLLCDAVQGSSCEWTQSALTNYAKETISVDLIDSDLRESSSRLEELLRREAWAT